MIGTPLPPRLRDAIAGGGDGLAVLVLRFGALGDVLRTLPAVRVLRRGLPSARISWVVDHPLAPLLEAQPELDEVLVFPRRRLRERSRAPWRWPGLVPEVRAWRRRLRDVGAGLALDFHGNLRSGVSTWLSGAPVRLGYAGHHQREANVLFTTHRVPSGARRTPRMQRNLDLVRALGLPAGDTILGGFAIPDAAREAVETLLGKWFGGGERRFAVIAPGVSDRQAYKLPPRRLLLAAIERLRARDVLPLVVHGPGELDNARELVNAAGPGTRLAPPTTVPELAALLRHARIFVGGDTGPMHLACSVGCPVLALYGPTDPVVNAPWGVPHAALFPPDRRYTGVKRHDRRLRFEGLSGRMVQDAIDRLLETSRAAVTGTPGGGSRPRR